MVTYGISSSIDSGPDPRFWKNPCFFGGETAFVMRAKKLSEESVNS